MLRLSCVVDGPIYGPFMGCNVTGFPPSAHPPQSRDVSCFSLKSFHFRGLRNQWVFFPYKSLYFECYATRSIPTFWAWATCDNTSLHNRRFTSQARWTQQFEAREEYESRIEGRRNFFSSSHLALRAKCRVRLAWLIKRLLCAYPCRLLQYRLERSAPRCLSNSRVFLGDADTIVSSLWLSHPFALQEETTKFPD